MACQCPKHHVRCVSRRLRAPVPSRSKRCFSGHGAHLQSSRLSFTSASPLLRFARGLLGSRRFQNIWPTWEVRPRLLCSADAECCYSCEWAAKNTNDGAQAVGVVLARSEEMVFCAAGPQRLRHVQMVQREEVQGALCGHFKAILVRALLALRRLWHSPGDWPARVDKRSEESDP